MKKDLLKVSIRQHAIYLPAIEGTEKREALTSTTVTLVAQLRKVGYSLSERVAACCQSVVSGTTGGDSSGDERSIGRVTQLGSIGERLGYTYRRNTFGSLDYMAC